MKRILAFSACSVLFWSSNASSSESDYEWLKAEARRQMEGSRVVSDSGVVLHTPDGIGHYKALWTRDFYYYLTYAGDLLDREMVKASIEYIAAGQRADGCIPDRVNAKGKPIYSPGGENNALADHAKDNGPFFALAVCEYADKYWDLEYLKRMEPVLKRGIDHISRGENGLVYNDPGDPQCVYGFTDIVAKTGHVLFNSLIYCQACAELARLGASFGSEYVAEYERRAELIRASIGILWNEESGMFHAADVDCDQVDIWGSMLAVHLGLASDSQSERILDYFLKNWKGLVQRGQVRHLAPGDGWQRFFDKVPAKATDRGVYQNGAYWATPLSWIVPVVNRADPERARQLVLDTVTDFRENGVAECINGDYRKVPHYVPSITALYAVRHWVAD